MGVMCAVINEGGQVLLSRRGDLNTWNLPGGRLDPGERLEEGALRELSEETGVTAKIDRAVGLYYLGGWQRVNVLFAGTPQGGKLRDKTRETRANRYFTANSLPQTVIGAKDALAKTRPLPQVIIRSPGELRRLRLRFGWRWLLNRLSGHPEPKFPHFHVRAVGVVFNDLDRRVLTLPGIGYNPADSAMGFRVLPRAVCDGETPPWEQLAQAVKRIINVAPKLQWVGLWEDTDRSMIELVFAAAIPAEELSKDIQWTTTRNAALSDRDMAYVERVKPTFQTDPVWTLIAHYEPNDIIIPDQETRP